jgi:hypothetical protein
MPKPVTRSLLMAVALLVVSAIPSALDADAGHTAHPYVARDSAMTVLLGYEAVEPLRNHLHAGQAEAFRMRARTSGITGAVHMFIDSGNAARAVAVGIYSDAGGRPGSLLSKGSASSLRVRAWNTVSVAPTQLASGKTYWLGVRGEGGTLRYRSRRRSCLNGPSVQTHLRGLPKRWSAGRARVRILCPISAYVVAARSSHAPSNAVPLPLSGSGKQKEGTPANCFSNPEGCGYPGIKTGVENCAALPNSSGTKTITKPETIENTDITGYVVANASNVKLNHDCIIFDGEEREGSAAVVLEGAATNFTISNSVVRGGNTTSESAEEAINNNHSDSGAVATRDRLEDCAECIHQAWTLEESYVIANGREKASEEGRAHTEDWWFSNNTIVAHDDTLLNPSKQTAVIFGESGGGPCVNHEMVTNSLLAGGGEMLYFCQQSSGNAGSSIEIKDNRFARRICTSRELSNWEGRGGFGCEPEGGGYFGYGDGTGGYFPRGGFFGVLKESEGIYNKGVGWEGNFWDNNLEEQPEQAYCPKC